MSLTPLLIMCLFISGIAEANGHLTYVPYHAQINQPTLDPGQIAKGNGGNQRSLQWKLLAYRHDRYDDTTSVFNYSDSVKYGYDQYGNADTLIGAGYSGGNWTNNQRIFYTYDHANITFGIGYNWDPTNSVWVAFADVNQTFNAGNKLLTTVYRDYVTYL